ncbi:MAG: nucleotidyltransferase domain-containing protein [Nitrospirota bacterium]
MENIFSTRERIRILETVIYKRDNISVNNIANQLKLSKGLVSKYFDILVKEGIAKKSNGKFVINNSSVTKGIRILLNINHISTKIFEKYPFIKSVGLYGSCAKGENNEDSDVDLWIMIGETSEEKQAALTSELNKAIKNLRILFLTDKKIEKLKKEDTLFYHSLAFGSIIIYGDKGGIQL